MDAVMYQTRTGCAWRYLPNDLPRWQTVFRCYQHWTRSSLLDSVHDALRDKVRQQAGRPKSPSVGIVDSQTVRSAGDTAVPRLVDRRLDAPGTPWTAP